jgi:hypothetical protein
VDKQKVQKVQQDQASDESESFFDKFFLMRSCTGLETTKSVEAEISGTPKPTITDDPVTTEPACDEKYPSEGAIGLTGSRKSTFAKRGENSAIRIQSVVRGVVGREMARVERRHGVVGREMARVERRQQIAIRRLSLRRGVIARDLIKSIKAKETSAVRIQRVARGSIVRNQVQTDNTAATRIQSNHTVVPTVGGLMMWRECVAKTMINQCS